MAITAVTQSYLVVVAGLVAQFFTELLLRRQPGFSDDTVHDAAVRYFGGAAGALLAYLVGRSVPVARRRPFLEANVLMIIVVAILARAGHHAGGAEGPYSVSFCTVLFCWSLIMPGGARYAAFPILGGLFTFYAVLFLSGGRGFFDVRTTAFAIFTTTSAGFSLLYAEVLERWRERVSLAVTTDPLTQLLSRAYVLERLATLLDPKRSPREPVSVLMVDVDHFKRVNDTHGHAVGDEVLRGVASALVAAARREDACGRLGGEEFVLLLDGCAGATALEVSERVRAGVAALRFQAGGEPFGVTVSIGVTTVAVDAEVGVEAALRAADRALYASKSEGRDRVTMAN
ncbi:MAG: GGDEF domain-containing protein [Sandaracinaceae bacterium]|nr:GGDEF domain-containing protein [Sandaracinaceae bacterium]